jgi:hypothetical protein
MQGCRPGRLEGGSPKWEGFDPQRDVLQEGLGARLRTARPSGRVAERGRRRRYHVTKDSLLDEGNSYSREFELYVNELGRAISGDPRFYFKRGTRSVPGSILHLARPFSLRRVYDLLPRFTAKVVHTDIRVVETTRSTAVIEWRSATQLADIPVALRAVWLEMSCQACQGAYAVIPSLLQAWNA